MNFIQNKLLYIVLTLLLIAYLSYSCYQYSLSYLDGDFPAIVLAVPPYDKVLEDPLGISTFNGETYAATNRFTAHAVMVGYFRSVPFLLQNIVSPVDSVYISLIIIKLIIHVVLLFLIGYYASAWHGFKWKYILIACTLISPLFISNGAFFQHMGTIDHCITYAMYYALPMIFILIFYLPFFRFFITGKIPKSKTFKAIWIILSLFLAFFGPLTSPVFLLGNAVLFSYLILNGISLQTQNSIFKKLWLSIKKIDNTILLLLIITGIFNLYSMYIGTKNAENGIPIPLSERYSLLLKGIKEVFFDKKSGVIYILVATIITLTTAYILYRNEYRKYFHLIFLLSIFCIAYILLLPLGGYRFYRPVILRRDTHLPILVIIYFYWSTSSIILLSRLSVINRIFPIIITTVIAVFYTKADLDLYNKFYSSWEKDSVSYISQCAISQPEKNCLTLKRSHPVAQWDFNTECEKSENAASLLEYYNITPRKIYFHYPAEKK